MDFFSYIYKSGYAKVVVLHHSDQIIVTFKNTSAMKKLLTFMTLAAVALMPMSCKKIAKDLIDSATGTEMDSSAALEKAAEAVAKIDTTQYKVTIINLSAEGPSDKCSNSLGFIMLTMVNKDNQYYYQHFYPNVDAPKPKNYPYKEKWEDVKSLSFDTKKLEGLVNECKSMIPKEYKYLCLNDIRMTSDETELTVHVQEIGKEKVESAGVSSDVYYVIRFKITPDGQIDMKFD